MVEDYGKCQVVTSRVWSFLRNRVRKRDRISPNLLPKHQITSLEQSWFWYALSLNFLFLIILFLGPSEHEDRIVRDF